MRGREEGIARGLLLPEDQPVPSATGQLLTSLSTPSLMHLLLLNGNGDLAEVMEKFAAQDAQAHEKPAGRESASNRQLHESSKLTDTYKLQEEGEEGVLDRLRLLLMRSPRRDHCSALLKLLPDGSDIVFGHNTWDDFR